jgi:hypothetical protein
MKTPEQVTVAILTGLELGIKPMQAIQGIAVINGRPSVWGDLALAIVRATGQLEYFKETYEGTPPSNWEKPEGEERKFKAVCRIKRRGEPEEVVSEFSIDDAIVAKLWMKRGGERGDKDTPWVTNPKRMLKMRARGFGLRDTFTDALKGVMIAEEMMGSEDADYRVVNEGPPPAPPAPATEITDVPVTVTGSILPERDVNSDLTSENTETAGGGSASPQPAQDAGALQVPAQTAPASDLSEEIDDEIPDWESKANEFVDLYDAAQSLNDLKAIDDMVDANEEQFTRRQREIITHAQERAARRLSPPEATTPPASQESPPAAPAVPEKGIPENPSTPEEYIVWWDDFLAHAKRSVDVLTRYANDTDVRDKLHPPLTQAQRTTIRKMKEARVAELKAAFNAER